MRRTRLVVLTASALLLVAGCTVPAPQPTPSGSASETPGATGPLACDTIVPAGDVAAALTGADGAEPEVVAAEYPFEPFSRLLTGAAGGLSCSWRAGEPPATLTSYGEGDWAYLGLDLLPEAADAWSEWAHDGGEHLPPSTFAGVEAVAGCGDPGCQVDLAVGGAWLTVSLNMDGWQTGTSRYGDADPLPLLEPVVRSAIASISAADPAGLEWPQVDGSGSRDCTGALDPVGIGAALGADGFAFEQHAWPLGDAAGRLGVYECWSTGTPVVGITVARGAAPVLDELSSTPDTDRLWEPVELEGAADGERALATCRTADGAVCMLLFSIGTTAFQVNADDPVAVAEAMIAQAR